MALPSLPGAGESPTDRVSIKILIDGLALSGEIQIVRVSVSKVYNKISTAKLIIADGGVEDQTFPQSNSDLFKPGKEIEIQGGYDENTPTIFKGIIVRHAIKIRNGSVLEIEAKDKAVKLTTARKSKNFGASPIKDSEIFEQIIGEAGLEKDVDPTTVSHKQIIQYNSTDWDFLVTRAEANAMFVLCDDGKIVIKKTSLSTDSGITFNYGGINNILEFDGEMDLRRQPNTIKSSSWDAATQDLVGPTEGSFSFAENGNISSDDLGAFLSSNIELKHAGNVPEPQLQSWADAFALRKHLAKSCGRLKVEGRPSLKPGQKITLKGLGDRFDGAVLVTGILHQFDGNFTTDIQFGWSEDWFYKKDDIIDKPAAGLLPGVTGLQIGVVQTIANDPEGAFRIQVKLPLVSQTEDGIWARISTVDAGSKRGFFFMPELGDEVIVGFINDDPRDAIVLGMLHSKGHEAPFKASDTNPIKGIVSREGMKLVFDDEKKTTTLSIGADASEKSITFDGSGGIIELKDEFGNSIKMESSGITISSSGMVTIKGSTVAIN
jgi:Rhs element Vgr protein